uniref:Selenoprotein O n=1 Tax=Helianthus annuus TaxID=4232 RepID=A0A251SXM1_HELAN
MEMPYDEQPGMDEYARLPPSWADRPGVFHACYSKVSPSVHVDNPKIVAWPESVAEILDLDPKEWGLF